LSNIPYFEFKVQDFSFEFKVEDVSGSGCDFESQDDVIIALDVGGALLAVTGDFAKPTSIFVKCQP
jgi:hypothetical protein